MPPFVPVCGSTREIMSDESINGVQERLEALRNVRLLALDVDGTLTDGRIIYPGLQSEIQRFDVSDGQGLRWLVNAGITVAWITGRGCEATERRAKELGVQELIMRSGPKRAALEALQARLGISKAETVSMGDDVPDLGLASASVLFCAPLDACEAVREAAGFVTQVRGGRGAVREVAEAILSAKNLFDSILDSARG